ncbi:MAG: response regulator transcription factor [Candidatus Didemnitutus sp.]|nr:response regulator transcription factor [Candidatus Didemnitutus sp.]
MLIVPPPVQTEHPPGSPFERLTLGEKRVALLLAEGLTNKEIAHALDLAEATIKNHVASIYRRTGLRGRGRFIACAAGRRPLP